MVRGNDLYINCGFSDSENSIDTLYSESLSIYSYLNKVYHQENRRYDWRYLRRNKRINRSLQPSNFLNSYLLVHIFRYIVY